MWLSHREPKSTWSTAAFPAPEELCGCGTTRTLAAKTGHLRGLLRHPAALAYHDGHLILVDADEFSSRLIGVDRETGRQTLLARTESFARPGKIVHSAAGDYYLSLSWPGEGGPAEIVRFDAKTRTFASAARYGHLEDPVALGITLRGDLIVETVNGAAMAGLEKSSVSAAVVPATMALKRSFARRPNCHA